MNRTGHTDGPFGNVVLTASTVFSGEDYLESALVHSSSRAQNGCGHVFFTYDGLDRRDAKTSDGKSYDLSYGGSSEGLSRETPGSGEARTYDRGSQMQVTGMAKGSEGSQGT